MSIKTYVLCIMYFFTDAAQCIERPFTLGEIFPIVILKIIAEYTPSLEIPLDYQIKEQQYTHRSITQSGTIILQHNGHIVSWNPLNSTHCTYQIPRSEKIDRITQGRVIIAECTTQGMYLKILSGDTLEEIVRFPFRQYYKSVFEISADHSTIISCKYPLATNHPIQKIIIQKIGHQSSDKIIYSDKDGIYLPLIINDDGSLIGAHNPRTFQLILWNTASKELIGSLKTIAQEQRPIRNLVTLFHSIAIPTEKSTNKETYWVKFISQRKGQPLIRKVEHLSHEDGHDSSWIDSRSDCLIASAMRGSLCIALAAQKNIKTSEYFFIKKSYNTTEKPVSCSVVKIPLSFQATRLAAKISDAGTVFDDGNNLMFLAHGASTTRHLIRLPSHSSFFAMAGHYLLLEDRIMYIFDNHTWLSHQDAQIDQEKEFPIAIPPQLKEILTTPQARKAWAAGHRARLQHNTLHSSNS